jgi:hypothetical protein
MPRPCDWYTFAFMVCSFLKESCDGMGEINETRKKNVKKRVEK